MFESYGCEVIVVNGMDVSDTEALGLSDEIMYSVFNGSIGELQVKDLIDLCLKIGYAPKIEYVKLTDIQ